MKDLQVLSANPTQRRTALLSSLIDELKLDTARRVDRNLIQVSLSTYATDHNPKTRREGTPPMQKQNAENQQLLLNVNCADLTGLSHFAKSP